MMNISKNTVEVVDGNAVNTPKPGINIRYFRKKKEMSQKVFADSLNEALLALDPSNLSEGYKMEYNKLKEKEVKQQYVSAWEKGEEEIPDLIIYLSAQILNLGLEWLTDHQFDIFEDSAFVQTGGVSHNNFHTIHTQSIVYNNDPKMMADGYEKMLETQKQFYLENYEPKKK